MVDTFTKFLTLTKPEVGASRDTWGAKQNDAFDKIDAWAEATDALAKAALSRSATGAQEVASPLTLKETVAALKSVSFALGLSVPEGVRASFGTGSAYAEAARFVVAAPGSTLDVLNAARDTRIARITGAGILLQNDKAVYTENNLNIADFLSKSATAAQELVSYFTLRRADPRIDLQRTDTNAYVARLEVDSSGALNVFNPKTNTTLMSLSRTGVLSTAPLGNLSDRIDSVAQDRANTALSTATTRINRKTLRFVFAGDLAGTWGANSPITEPYPGAVMTTRSTVFTGGNYLWADARFRYLQMSDSEGNFYSIGY